METSRKRRRPPLSCTECRRRKVKCDRKYPCSHCILWATTCHYVDMPSRPTTSASTENQRSSISSKETLKARPNDGSSTVAASESHQSRQLDHIQQMLNKLISSQHLQANTTFFGPNPPNAQSPESSSPEYDQCRLHLKKSKLFGSTHWSGASHIFKAISALLNTEPNDSEDADTLKRLKKDIFASIQRCKALHRTLKATRPWSSPDMPSFFSPTRHKMDGLIRLYTSHFESVFRILHIPSFLSDYELYWRNPVEAPKVQVLKIQLAASIGSSICQQTSATIQHRDEALRWIQYAQTWLSGPIEKNRITISGLQVQCLLILARQTWCVGGDLVWITMGTIVRIAMQMGLHRDPKHFDDMTVLHAEMRRRVWATILELNVQAALDSGALPSISFDNFDTIPPSNANDEDLSDHVEDFTPQPDTKLTEASLQRTLLKCLQPRLEILRQLNSMQLTLDQDKVFYLTDALNIACRECSSWGERFKRNFADMLIRRFILPLHLFWGEKSSDAGQIHASRRIGLDAAMALLSPSPDEDLTRLVLLGGGMFKNRLIHISIAISSELLHEIQEHQDGSIMDEPCAYRRMLIEAAEEARRQWLKRIELCETNIKLHMKLSIVIGQATGADDNISTQQIMAQSAKASLETCYSALQSRFTAVMGIDDEATRIFAGGVSDDDILDFDSIWQSAVCVPPGGFGIDI